MAGTYNFLRASDAESDGRRMESQAPQDVTTTPPEAKSGLCSPVTEIAKGGAPKGNTNKATHYMRSAGWPKGAMNERRAVQHYMRALREAVIASTGELDIVAAGIVQTAGRHERAALLAARYLRIEHDQLTPTERLAFLTATAKHSEARDRCVKSLGLHPAAVAPKDAWEQQGQLLDALDAETEGDDHAS